jgi:hypothetical protein
LTTDPEDRVQLKALPEKKVVGLERGPLSLVSTTEELLDRKGAVPSRKPRIQPQGPVTLTTWHPLSAKKLAITSPTSGGRSFGIVRSRTQTMEGFFCKFLFPKATRGLEPISYRRAILSTLLHATVYIFFFFTKFAECTSTDCK